MTLEAMKQSIFYYIFQRQILFLSRSTGLPQLHSKDTESWFPSFATEKEAVSISNLSFLCQRMPIG